MGAGGGRVPTAAAVAAAAAATAVAALLAALALRRRRRAAQYDSLPVIVLRNRVGAEVHITPVGASIQRLLVPVAAPRGAPQQQQQQQQGAKVDVVLGFEHPSTYALLEGTPYFGCVVGRVANRIAGGRFKLGGRTHQLATNNGPNALHGGPQGFHRKVWEASPVAPGPGGGPAVTLSYESPDGEEGYPGCLAATVTYELAAGEAALTVTMEATTDQPTPVNLAQHSYFNLRGHGRGDVLGHRLAMDAPHYTPVDDHQIPSGQIMPVAGTPFDFTPQQPGPPRSIGERLAAAGPNGYDHNLVLFGLGAQARFRVQGQRAADTPRLAATVVEPDSGLRMEVLTTAPGVQLYTGGFLGGRLPDTKGGARYPRYGGLCLETQAFPDSINQPAFPSVVLQPGETYRHVVVYRFRCGEREGEAAAAVAAAAP